MKTLVLITLAIFDYASSTLFVTDTPAVVAQKQLFQKLYNAAALAAAAAPDVDVYPKNQQEGHHQSEHQQQNQQQHPSYQEHSQWQPHQEHQGNQHQQDSSSNNQHQNNYEHQEQGFSNNPNEHHQVEGKLSSGDNNALPNQWKGPLASKIPAGLPGSMQVENTPEVNDAIVKFAKAYEAAVLASMAVIARDSSHKTSSTSGKSHLTERSAQTTDTQSEGSHDSKDETTTSVPKLVDSPEITATKLHFSKIFQKQLMHLLGLS